MEAERRPAAAEAGVSHPRAPVGYFFKMKGGCGVPQADRVAGGSCG